MNTKLLKVALPALMLAAFGAEAKKFEGAHVGADINYKAESQTFKDKNNTGDSRKWKPSGMGFGVNAGYTEMMGSVYVGGDVQAGYGFGSQSETRSLSYRGTTFASTKLELKQSWNLGLGGLVGMDCMDDCMAFFRLGFDYSNYKAEIARAGLSKKSKTYGVWHVVPGVGIKWKMNQDWAMTGRYEYGHQLTSKTVMDDAKSDKGHFHGIRLGVSYSL